MPLFKKWKQYFAKADATHLQLFKVCVAVFFSFYLFAADAMRN